MCFGCSGKEKMLVDGFCVLLFSARVRISLNSHGKENNFHKEQLCQTDQELDPGNLHNYSSLL